MTSNKELEDKAIQDAYKNMRSFDREEISEVVHPNNIGIMELFQFYEKAQKEKNFSLIDKVKGLVKNKKNSAAWQIIQDYLGVKLQGHGDKIK